MLKKILSLAMGAALALTMVACGNNTQAKSVDLSAFASDVTANHELPEKMDVTQGMGKDLLNTDFPGLSDMDTQQLLAYLPVMDVGGGQMVLVETKSQEDADKVKELFQTTIDNKVNGGAFYPAAVELWTNSAEVVSNGNYVMLVAHADKDAIVEQFNALFQ